MKEKRIPVLIAAVLLLLITAAVAWEVAKRYIPSKEPADLNQVLGVEGEETAIFFNEELQKVKGITRDDQTYLPIDWVNDNLNEKFYWDNVEKLLVYTLPDTIVYADKRTMGSTGLPLLLVDADKVYLSVGLINNYTAVDMASYTNQEHKRIYLDNRWETRLAGTVGRRSPVRVEADIKSPILTQAEKGAGLVVLEQSEQWSKVRTGDGHTGYVKSRAIARIDPQENPCVMKLPEYTSISMDEKVCLVWHQVTHESANEVMEELMENTKGVNVIAPTWFALTDNKGHYHSYASREYVDRAHDMGLQVWAALDNFNMGDNVNSEILFAQTSVRKSLIARLMEDVKTYNLDGINLDIESITPPAPQTAHLPPRSSFYLCLLLSFFYPSCAVLITESSLRTLLIPVHHGSFTPPY